MPVSITLYQKYGQLLSYLFIHPLLSIFRLLYISPEKKQNLIGIWATELLIKNPIVDICQNFGHGLR